MVRAKIPLQPDREPGHRDRNQPESGWVQLSSCGVQVCSRGSIKLLWKRPGPAGRGRCASTCRTDRCRTYQQHGGFLGAVDSAQGAAMMRWCLALLLLTSCGASERDAWLAASVAGGVVAAGGAVQAAHGTHDGKQMLPAVIAVGGAIVCVTGSFELYSTPEPARPAGE